MNLAFGILAECPHCGEKKELFQLGSGNNIGSETWSDRVIKWHLVGYSTLKTQRVSCRGLLAKPRCDTLLCRR